MSRTGKTDFSTKHGPDLQVDPKIKAVIETRATDQKMPCAVAFDVAGKLNVPAKAVGMALDLMNFRITKCQLGLFGYSPEKKITHTLEAVSLDLKAQIETGLVDGRLPCQTAWTIAEQLNIGKMGVSNACETLGIKIKPCQLGAF